MRLNIDWDEFKTETVKLIFEGKSIDFIISRNSTIIEYNEAKIQFDNWTEKVIAYLGTAFNESQNEYILEFKQAKQQRFNLSSGHQIDKEPYQLLTVLKEDLKEKINNLEKNIRILEVLDAVIKPEEFNLVDRNSYSVEQVLSLILEKLNDLYDDSYYSIVAILNGNGINMKRPYEDREYGSLLEDYGYVDIFHRIDTFAKLTLKGRLHVEEKRKTFFESYEDINLDKAQMDKRIDEIMERLNSLGLGQEILFDELQDLRETYVKLSKKSWGQLVKGKLVDLSLAKIIDNDTISYVYEKLTNHELRLP